MSGVRHRTNCCPGPDVGGPMRLTYLIGRYPVLTETFIDREILQLIERGVDLKLVSIRQPDAELSPRQRELRQRVTYLMPVSVVKLAVRTSPPSSGVHARTSARWRGCSPGGTRTARGDGRCSISRPASTRPGCCGGGAGVHIHAHLADRAATVALVASRFLDTTYSVTAHAREIYVAPVLLRERLGQAAFTATCTEYNRRHLATVVDPEVAGSILRLYHGLDLSTFIGSAGAAPAVDPPMLLSVAQLWERKGLEDLVRACRVLADRGVAASCRIVGEGPLRGRLEGLIAELDLGDRVVHRCPASSRGRGPARPGTGLRAALRGGPRR